MSYIYDMADTWNSAGTTFNAIKMNVTDTASAAGSLLMNLQVGGASQFSVAKTGLVTLNPALTTGGVLSAGTNAFKTIQFGSTAFGSNGIAAIRDGEGVVVRGSTGFAWEDGANNPASGVVDLRIVRDAANTLAQRNGVNAQTFRVYNTYTDASNYERGELSWSANNFTVGTTQAGTGLQRRLTLSGAGDIVLSTSNSQRWNIAGAGHFLAVADNTLDIGASGANRPRNLYVAGRANIDGLTVGKGGQTAVTNNTALGGNALNSASLTGGDNTAIGTQTLEINTTGTANTAVGLYALLNNTTASFNAALGKSALAYFNTSNNTAVGLEALRGSTTVANNTGSSNTAIGLQALGNNTTGSTAVAVGVLALTNNTTGGSNTAVGSYALRDNTTGSTNVAVGTQAMMETTTGSNNVAMGTNALRYVNTSNNTALGYEALRGSTTVANNTGSNNSALGVNALRNNTTGSENSAVGYQALQSNTTGNSNSAVGRDALKANTTGLRNTAVGLEALGANSTGSDNSAFGRYALLANVSGANNVAAGVNAGDVITTGSNNTIVGQGSNPSANNGNSQTVIGQGLTGKGDDTFFCGGTNGAYNEKNVTTWETTSDARIKKNIVSNGVGLEVINRIEVRNFEYRAPEEITELPQSAAIKQSGVQLGVIAQELQGVLPECVTENSTGVLSVNTDPLVWYLINAVKQLSAEVKALKGE